MPSRKPKTTTIIPQNEGESGAILTELRALIAGAQTRAAVAVNQELVLLYWDLGHRIRVEILKEERADYGEKIVKTLSGQLTEEFGKGYGRANLFSMVKFAELFPTREIVQTLSGQLSWSHFVEILRLQDPLEREFYATLCHASSWSVRGLRKEIAGALFARTSLSTRADETIRRDLELLRDEDTVKRPADYQKWLKQSEADSIALETALRAKDAVKAEDSFKKIMATCSSCHAVYRNVPQK